MSVAATVALVFTGCGGAKRQDASEPSGNFRVDVVTASFPKSQHIAAGATMRIAVRNTGKRAIPNLAVTVDSFDKNSDQQGLADASRPVWIVQHAPLGGDTAYVNTWATGRPLKPGATQRFEWKVTPVVPGKRIVHWTVAAGLNGKAHAQTSGGRRPHGAFTVSISDRPADATVDPATGAVVRDRGR